MPAPVNNNPTNYENLVYDLMNNESDFNIAKKRFEDKFTSFLCKYKPYSDIKDIPFNKYILDGRLKTT